MPNEFLLLTKHFLTMLSTIIWLVGLILAIKAALEIWNLNGDTFKKVVFVVLVLICSWVGLLVYYLFARDKMAQWVK